MAHAALGAGVSLGTGYPGTPSSEILETFSALGGAAEWSPNEKVAYEVALGVAYGGGRAVVTMKHVGLNVASDPLFASALTGVSGALVVAVADDPGLVSSQNQQDSRHYAHAAGLPMLEPSDAQEAFDYFLAAVEISERWKVPVLLRLTARVSHSESILRLRPAPPPPPRRFERDREARVMIPSYARIAHRRLRSRLAEIREWGESCELNRAIGGDGDLGVITSGVSALHVMEADPRARILKLGLTYPLPARKVREFAASVARCMVIEEGDPVLSDACRVAGAQVSGKPDEFRFDELDVTRVRDILSGQEGGGSGSAEFAPPRFCSGCSYHRVFSALRDLDCIVAGDIGCYTLGSLPPFEAIDTTVCMGASIGVGLGLRHALPPEEATRVVSIIGDSTFIHSGIPGIVEMIYNRPARGHVVVILDNGTCAMTGLQEHPATGRTLDHRPTGSVVLEDLVRSLGVQRVSVLDPAADGDPFRRELRECLASEELCVIISRRLCLLAVKRIKGYDSPRGDPERTGK